MRRELLIAAGPGEWRAVLLENGIPVELRVERGDGFEAGSIHFGRVIRLLPVLGAALIEIGGDRPAFLPQNEIFPRHRRLDEGERVVVQIRREAQCGKAARLSTAIGVRGGLIELTSGRPGLGGAEMLSPADRERLHAIIAAASNRATPSVRVLPSLHPRGECGGEGRTEQTPFGLRLMQSAPIEAFVAEAKILRDRWNDIVDDTQRLDRPARLHPAATVAAALAGVIPFVKHILVDEPAAIPEIRAAFREATVAQSPETQWPLDLDTLFEEALSPTVGLPGGGSIHIEPTRTAVLIDVDSGTPDTGSAQQTAFTTDLAAAEAIAFHIRLRNLSGGILVDFVGLDDRGARERLRAAFARALAADPMQPQILGWTRLGHLELVRRRRARSLADSVLESTTGGAFVKTALTVAYEALRALRREGRAQPGRAWRIIVAPAVAAALTSEAAGAMRVMEQRFGRTIAITPDARLERDRFQISPA
jgi:ribonuclease G